MTINQINVFFKVNRLSVLIQLTIFWPLVALYGQEAVGGQGGGDLLLLMRTTAAAWLAPGRWYQLWM
jgi:hypothetical protein